MPDQDMTDDDRIEYCRQIIREKPGTPAARNARWLIRELQAAGTENTDPNT